MYRFRWPDRLVLLGALMLFPTAGSAQCRMGSQGTPLQSKALKGRSTTIVCPVMGRKVPKSQAVSIAYKGKMG